MIRVVVEVGRGAARHRLVVQSSNIRAALSVVEEHYLDGGEARVVFPIDPDPFFVRDPGAVAGLMEVESIGEAPPEPQAEPLLTDGSGKAETPRLAVEKVVESPPPENTGRSDHAKSA